MQASLKPGPVQRRRRQTGLPVVALVLLYCLVSSVLQAQDFYPDLVQLSDGRNATSPPPRYASNAHWVEIDAERLLAIGNGDRIGVRLSDGEELVLEVTATDQFLNGDLSLQARSIGTANAPYSQYLHSLSLTIGRRTLLGSIRSDLGSFLLHAMARQGGYAGWLYQAGDRLLGNNDYANDYVIPNIERGLPIMAPVSGLPGTLPLAVAADPVPGTAAHAPRLDTGSLHMHQEFSSSPVIAGATVQLQASFENTSQEWLRNLSVEFYFILENSELLTAAPGCVQQLSLTLQAVLYCNLGDLAPGEITTLTYSVATSAASKPQLLSTAIVKTVRHDAVVNVVEDVRLDSDGDGISDFNESLLGTDADDADSVDASQTVIDVMALYSTGAESLYPGAVYTRINQLINVANQIFADSEIGISLRPVHYQRTDHPDQIDMDEALDDLLNASHPAFSEVGAMRERYGADLVMLFRPLGQGEPRCGLAPVGGFATAGDFSNPAERDFGYSLIGIDCPTDIVVAHELGHNMGLTHSHLEDGTGGTFHFSTGYGVDSAFVTVMAFPAAFNAELRLHRFSNPRLSCLDFACGLDAESEFGADAALSLNLVRHQIANYYPSRVPDLPTVPVHTYSGTNTAARIAIAASTDGGFSFVESLRPGMPVDILADIQVDPTHVGQLGSLHILIDAGEYGVLQLGRDGVVETWDGTAASLKPAREEGLLRIRERLTLSRGYRVDASLLGLEMNIYLAYHVLEANEFVYMTEPLRLRVVQ